MFFYLVLVDDTNLKTKVLALTSFFLKGVAILFLSLKVIFLNLVGISSFKGLRLKKG